MAFGVVKDDEIIEIRGSIFTRFRLTDNRLPLSEVTLLPPTEPTGIWGPGPNSANHSATGAQSHPVQVTEPPGRPEPWRKGRNSLTGHGDPIIIPRDSGGEVHCQGEAVAVIGKNCRRVSPADARKYILGYACGNDVCDRTWQREDTTVWRAKGSDTFAPVGPWIETDINPQELELILRLNGEEVQRVNTRDMLFTFAEIVSCLSQQVTLHPGDLVFSGTAAVTSAIKPGDVVEVEIPGIGMLHNPVAAEYDASAA
jgi:2-keto-4-pentenoate hydratase/2-oxohepta-3-ene-1,7-dioic acid hydratase in catechol pathway